MVAISLLEQWGDKTTVAAVCPGASSGPRLGGSGQRGGSWKEEKKPGRGGVGDSGQQVSYTVSHAEQASLETRLCFI